jgi:glycosyltransferase involved in cell wall biosynthesis
MSTLANISSILLKNNTDNTILSSAETVNGSGNSDTLLRKRNGNRSIPFFIPSDPIPELAVVIPANNNELTIGTQVILSKKYASTVIVVDSGSTDRTVEVAESAGAVVVDAISYGGGRVQSILAGCKMALGYDCTAVVLNCSGGEHLNRDIFSIAKPVLDGEADLVIGSRYISGRKGIPPYQLNTTTASCDLPNDRKTFSSTDPNSTFRAISVKGICMLDLLPDSDLFEPMMISLFSRKGLKIKEIPIKLRNELEVVGDDNLPRYRSKKVAVVVPAHNEELLIGETLSGIPDFVAKIYVVNDKSSDRTQEIIDYYADHDDSIVLIHHEINKGVGATIVNGYRRALEDGMDVVAVMAGDNQMDPAFLPQLLDPVIDKKCDYTMGNRLVSPEYRKGMSTWRFIGNSVLTLLTKIASGYWQMVDPQNGYTVISHRALERINLDDVFTWYGYCNDLLVKLNVIGFRVINIPHPARYGREKSGIKYSSYIVKLSWLLFKDFIWRLKVKYVLMSFHPLVFFYLAGGIFTIAGMLGGIYSLYYKFILGNSLFIPLTLSLLILGFGLQALFFAMFFDMQQEKNTNGWYQ